MEKQLYKMLIVDDEEKALGIVQGLFQDAYQIKICSSAKSAKCFFSFASKEELPDIVIIDVSLPEEGGFDLANYLKNDPALEKIPFVFQSSSYDPTLQERAFELGASDFILKPYNKTIANARISKAIEMSVLKNNLKNEVERQTFLVKEMAEELMRKSIEILDVLVSTIETSDEYTKGHSSRVSIFSEALAKKSRYPREKLPIIRRAGMLHDIGKIGVSDRILNKNGKLSKNEYSIVKQHPEDGSKILSNIDNFVIEADVALHHHEKWDGTGYPFGIKGDAISIESRIVAIADVFDVMKFGRIYQVPKTNEEIAEEFERLAGTQFDPNLAKLFAKMVRNGELDKLITKKSFVENGL